MESSSGKEECCSSLNNSNETYVIDELDISIDFDQILVEIKEHTFQCPDLDNCTFLIEDESLTSSLDESNDQKLATYLA